MKFLILLSFVAMSAQALTDNPYYFGAKIPKGPYKNQVINITLKRAVSTINNTRFQGDLVVPENYRLVANIFHNKKFYIGLVPNAGVEQVLFLSEPFGGIFSHSMLRFRMRKPVKLIAEVPTEEEFRNGVMNKPLETPIEIDDLIVSVEATSPPGVKEFSTFASFFSTRGLAMRVISLTGRGVSKLLKAQAKVVQMPLDMSEREANRSLRNAFAVSEEWGMSQMYNTALKNCNSICFNLIESAKTYVKRNRDSQGRLVGYAQEFASRVVIFSKVYPPLARLGITWRSWRTRGAPDDRNLEDDPNFKRLAATYPGVCEEDLAGTNAPSGVE
jgi:hypothetical protein